MPHVSSKDKDTRRRIELKKFNRRVSGRKKKKKKRRLEAENNYRANSAEAEYLEETFGLNVNYQDVIEEWLPANLLYILKSEKSNFSLNSLEKEAVFQQAKPIVNSKTLYLPTRFSLIDNPDTAYKFLRKSIVTLLFGNYREVYFSYKNCEMLDVGAQVFLDIIKKECMSFIRRCRRYGLLSKVGTTTYVGLTDMKSTSKDIWKVLTSIGSLAIHANVKSAFKDIVPYRLCIHNREQQYNKVKAIEQKDIDTTTLADYVIDSLAKMHKKLTPEKLEDLCTIIGEILINAEEHATTHHRFSIGYFQDKQIDGKHIGVFRLVILNFGKTIHETFVESDTPSKEILDRMKELSKKYTKKKLFFGKEFEEENLWTLYALQEGVTSTSDLTRGNGSIQFIDSFFSIKGDDQITGDRSRMTILSGNTSITFDGTYRITEKISEGQKFKVMTFNNKGSLEKAPDKNFVKYVNNYFPGTLISARIFLNDDDFI